MGKLTATRVRALKAPGRYGDGDGLYLLVGQGNARSWVQRIKYGGRRRDIGLGRFPDVSLALARDAAVRNRALIAAGRDPLAQKRRTAMPTFREAAERVFEANRPRWRNGKHAAVWMQSLERHAYPTLSNMPVDSIDRTDVLHVLTPIWSTKPETARRVRQRIRTILKWAQAHGFVEHNAAGEAIDGGLPPMPKVTNHMRALPYREVGGVVEAVRQSQASLAAKWCLEFLILTAARSGEARGAAWAEIDMDAATWTVPATRMKAHAEHRVPLCGRALAILDEAQIIDDGSGLVFPSTVRPGCPMSDMTLTVVLRRIGVADRATVHGFRSSFRDFAAECTNAPHAVMELSLAHAVGNSVEVAYARSDLFDRRRTLMENWAAYVEGNAGRVVPMARGHE